MYSSTISSWRRLSTNSRYGQRSLTAASVVLSAHHNDGRTIFYGFSADSSLLGIICLLFSKHWVLQLPASFQWITTVGESTCSTIWHRSLDQMHFLTEPSYLSRLGTNTRNTLTGWPPWDELVLVSRLFVPPPNHHIMEPVCFQMAKKQKQRVIFFIC